MRRCGPSGSAARSCRPARCGAQPAARSRICLATQKARGGCRMWRRRCRRACWAIVADKHIVDLCAAPGGKTAQLAAAGAAVTAIDRSARRMTQLTKNFARLHLSAETAVAEAETWMPAAPVDAVLVDAPCSATGTIRRHPDAMHLKRAERYRAVHRDPGSRAGCGAGDAAARRHAGLCRLLAAARGRDRSGSRRCWPAAAPARRVPITPDEIGGMAELISPEGDLRSFPFQLAEQGGMDAFFAARLKKQ